MKDISSAFEKHLEKDPTHLYAAAFSDREGNVSRCDGVPGNPCQNVYSVAKAFTAAAVGVCFDRGLINPEDKICDILSDFVPENIDGRWFDVTVDMALTHKTGLPGTFLDIDALDPKSFGRDYLGFTLKTKLIYDPGKDSIYTDGSFYLLSRCVEAVSGKALDDLMWETLLFDLGFTELAWSRCPLGHPMGATGLYIKCEDMVKLGVLYLNRGVYKGKRLLSEKWIDLTEERGYGFGKDGNGLTISKGGMQSYEGNTGVLFRFIEANDR